jgi:FkbM family methyltransferase
MSALQKLKGVVYGRSAVLAAVWNHPLNRGSRVRAVRDYFVWNVARFGMDAKHVIPLTDDLDIILGKKENYGSAVYAHNLSDYHEMLFLAHLLRPGDLFLDVGANVGMYSVWVSGVTDADSIAFEPVPATFDLLQRNIRLNDLAHRITAHQVAAGADAGSVLMTSSKGGLDHIVLGEASEGSVRVPIERLDELVAGRAPAAMKVDVEGFELAALKGGAGVLTNASLRAIVIELQDWTLKKFGTSEAEVRDYLASFGFRPHAYDPKSRALTEDPRKAGLNAIFVRPDPEIDERLRSAPRITLPMVPEGV